MLRLKLLTPHGNDQENSFMIEEIDIDVSVKKFKITQLPKKYIFQYCENFKNIIDIPEIVLKNIRNADIILKAYHNMHFSEIAKLHKLSTTRVQQLIRKCRIIYIARYHRKYGIPAAIKEIDRLHGQSIKAMIKNTSICPQCHQAYIKKNDS